MGSQNEADWWSLANWKGPDNRANIETLFRETPLAALLSELNAWVTGDHQVLKDIAGVRYAPPQTTTVLFVRSAG